MWVSGLDERCCSGMQLLALLAQSDFCRVSRNLMAGTGRTSANRDASRIIEVGERGSGKLECAMSTAEQLWGPFVRLKNILFAMDFSPGSMLAFPFAASIARHYGGNIVMAHIVPDEDYQAVPSASYTAINEMEAELEEALSSPLGNLRDIPHELLFDHGDIRTRLLAVAESRAIDLIVIGTHGWRGVKKLLKGSTAEEIAVLAARAVLTVGPNVARRPDFKRILYATDFSAAAAHAMPYALSLAHAYDASLLFLHVNDWSSEEPPVDATPKTFEFIRDQLRKSGYGKEMVERSQVIVDFGSRTDLILEAANKREADLIIMGLQASGGIKTRIATHLPGSTAYDVTARAPCPVMTVPLGKEN